jgi:YidC/Oxa1 family membrane protein insertase
MEKKELSMEVRLLIAFVLMGLVIVWQYSMRPLPNPTPAAGAASGTGVPAAPTGQDPAKTTAIRIPPQTPVPAEVPGSVQAAAEETFTVETDVFRVQFSNRGGVAKSWILKTYSDHAGRSLELVNRKAIETHLLARGTTQSGSRTFVITAGRTADATQTADTTQTVDATWIGATIAGRGIPAGTTITEVTNSSTVLMSNPADDTNNDATGFAINKLVGRVPAPFALVFKGQAPSADLNTALYKVTHSDAGREIRFEYSDGRTAATKTFKFTPSTYLLEVSSEVVSNGIRIPHELAWRGGFGDSTVINPANDQHALYYDLSNAKLKQVALKEAKDAPVSNSGRYSFAGLEDHYFAGVYLSSNPSSVELTTFSDAVPSLSGTDEQRIGAGVGGEGLNKFAFFAGPKDSSLLGKVDPKLEQLIDWGTWFGFIAKPLFLVLQWIAVRMTHNYGWAIVVLTIGINMVLFPLRLTSMKSSKKMQALQPQIKAINEKYKSLPMRDPKKSEQQQELMDLYKKNGVNPVGGCLPMALQLPVLVAFYTVLSVTIELRGANWLWVHDLSQAESLPIHILPILVVVTQFISQKMTPNPGMDPAQAKMMLFMPLMMGYFFYFYSAGLALYWFTGGLVSIVQQLILNQTMPTPAVSAPKPKKKK